jgi:hypothetical protein
MGILVVIIMNKSCLKDNIDWLIYADYLDDQNINHFIREDVADINTPWNFEYSYKGIGTICSGVGTGLLCNVGCSAGFIGGIGMIGVGCGRGEHGERGNGVGD